MLDTHAKLQRSKQIPSCKLLGNLFSGVHKTLKIFVHFQAHMYKHRFQTCVLYSCKLNFCCSNYILLIKKYHSQHANAFMYIKNI